MTCSSCALLVIENTADNKRVKLVISVKASSLHSGRHSDLVQSLPELQE